MLTQAVVEFYDRRIKQVVTDNLKLYWQARKFKIETRRATNFSPVVGSDGQPVGFQEINNWENIQAEPTRAIDPRVDATVVSLGQEIAFTVDLLLRMEAAKYGNSKDVRNLYVSDIFEQSDGSPNLHVNIVQNAPLSVADPAGLIPGWVSYKFLFACGFPAKSESEYVLSSQSEHVVSN